MKTSTHLSSRYQFWPKNNLRSEGDGYIVEGYGLGVSLNQAEGWGL